MASSPASTSTKTVSKFVTSPFQTASIADMVAQLKAIMAPYNGSTVTEMIAKTSINTATYAGKTVSEMITETSKLLPGFSSAAPTTVQASVEQRFKSTIGNDFFGGTAKNDSIYAEAGNDTLYGGAGNDSLNGALGNDLLFGDTGNDTLVGGAGADTLRGGVGSDMLVGGSEADVFVFENRWGSDRILDFKVHQDKIDMRQAGVHSLADLTVTTSTLGVTIQHGSDSLLLHGVKAAALSASDFIWS